MTVLVRLALRNLLEHKGKTLIVGLIIAFGVTILIVGSSFLDSASRSLSRAFIESFTGQVIITGKAR
ncbi:MAG TPA: ABC transporter permease, partial [Spirochaetia bacterium]|nr:ABC transporter permease [Spirochaetia bacterium]